MELPGSILNILLRMTLAGDIPLKRAYDAIRQVDVFERDRPDIESKYAGNIIVVCGERIFYGASLDEALRKARKEFPDRPYYAAAIGIPFRWRSSQVALSGGS